MPTGIYKRTPEQKEKLRQKILRQYKSGERKPSLGFKGKKHIKEYKEKLSLSRMGSGNPYWGKKHTNKTKEKMSEAKKGIKHWA